MKDFSNDQLQFAALIAHQLKSPIAAVSTLLQTVQGELAGPITPKQREILEKAILRCNQSMSASQRLLNISRTINDPQAFKDNIDVIKTANEVIENNFSKAKQQNIELLTDFDFVKAIVKASQTGLSEVFEALINNAIKYTPDHGRILINISNDENENLLKISISDSGIGIPEDDIEHLFKPFYRSKTAKKSDRPGTGLGLWIVKTIVNQCGGTVTAGKGDLGGAQFTIKLPIVSTQTEHETDAEKSSLKVVIIGGVAAGPKVAAKVMRLNPNADVTIIEKGKFLSYAGCGFPYYISGQVKDQTELMSSAVGVVRDPVFFQKVKNVHIMNQTEAIEIDRENKRVKIVDLLDKTTSSLDYDKLVLATGSMPMVPQCSGMELDNIFTLHGPSDAEGIKATVERTKAKDVVIVGGGLIGIEMTEALTTRGCRVNIIEKTDQILPMLDFDMAKLIENHLESHGVKVITNSQVLSFEPDGDKTSVGSVVCTAGDLKADMVIISTGIKANNLLAQKANIEIGTLGGIKVNQHMQTSDEHIYAAGDCVESENIITKKPYYIPLGSTANKQGRVVAVNICGGKDKFPGVLGTVCCKIFDYSMAKTGLSEKNAIKAGFDVVSSYAPGPDREHFAADAKNIMLKLTADRKTARILGVQAAGPGQCVKRIDVAAMAITNKMTIYDLANADLCYGPPFSPVIDNIMTAANIASNKIENHFTGISPLDLYTKIQNDEDLYILDVRTPNEFAHSRLENSNSIPLASLRARLGELPAVKQIVTLCNVSLRGYEASIILKSAGFDKVMVLDGGLEMWPFEKIQ